MSAWWFWVVRFSRRLLVRASLYALFAVAAALVAAEFAPLVPKDLAERLGGEAVEGILSALATSLLAVATFSVSAVVVAYTAASAQLTPRAASFITADRATQGALATFVGAFLFTIVALVALGANYYGEGGRTILFLATLLMVAIVAIRLIGWIDRLSRLAHHSHLLQQIEASARNALHARAAKPFLGGAELKQESESGAVLKASQAGYVANIDPSKLEAAAGKLDCHVEVLVLPGDFVGFGDPLLRLPEREDIDEALREDLLGAFAFADTRTFEQDPFYGVQVLVEAAARALSPGVNDPGTAILAIDSCYRLLNETVRALSGDRPDPICQRLRARDFDACMLLSASLGEIARYSAGDAMVAERLQRALTSLAAQNEDAAFTACARETSAAALARAEAALAFEPDRERVRAASAS